MLLFFLVGFYCTGGESSSNRVPCEKGHYCQNGSYEGTTCPSGTYQDQTGQKNCKTCPPGCFLTVAVEENVFFKVVYVYPCVSNFDGYNVLGVFS